MARNSDIIDELVYARVLVTLQVQQLKRSERELRDRLRTVLEQSSVSPDEQHALCERALARAWDRAATTLLCDGPRAERERGTGPQLMLCPEVDDLAA